MRYDDNRDNTSIGILEWFHFEDRDKVENTLSDLEELGITRLRTGVSWADWHREGAREWFDWLFGKLAQTELDVLPCFCYTPPSIGELPMCSAPPRDLQAFADFLDHFLGLYGDAIEYVELWNEPNNQAEWDFTRDDGWAKFADMVGRAARWVGGELGYKIVLGGMSPIDPGWLDAMGHHGVLDYVDVVGVHGFPGTWEKSWTSWAEQIGRVQDKLDAWGSEAEIWITEAGFSSRDYRQFEQLTSFLDTLDAPADRLYWYGLYDLAEDRPTIRGLHFDERDYHCGIKHADGTPKLLYRLLRDRSVGGVAQVAAWHEGPDALPESGCALVTGGAGFVGSNVTRRLLEDGREVIVADTLAREGVELNLGWLKERYGDQLHFTATDMRNRLAVNDIVRRADEVYHFAGQVAVTTSLEDPRGDFSANALSTLNVLEAMRRLDDPPSLVFTSTNKVYGGLKDIGFVERKTRYEPDDAALRDAGVSEAQQLEFRSPYGCSKGVADQYVLDYAKTFGLPATVFRMSCIYGPRQFGTEDQGWVAHFLIQALDAAQITIFGDGKQVRDILFVDDLVDAMRLAHDEIEEVRGQAFNIGGGPANTTSLLELLELIERLDERAPTVVFDDWRPGDQRYYVSDTSKFTEATGWQAQVSVTEGVGRLYDWLVDFRGRRDAAEAGATVSAAE